MFNFFKNNVKFATSTVCRQFDKKEAPVEVLKTSLDCNQKIGGKTNKRKVKIRKSPTVKKGKKKSK